MRVTARDLRQRLYENGGNIEPTRPAGHASPGGGLDPHGGRRTDARSIARSIENDAASTTTPKKRKERCENHAKRSKNGPKRSKNGSKTVRKAITKFKLNVN